MKIFKA